MKCKRCGKELTKKQQKSYCSLRCSKLHLKSLYRKRNKDRINNYNREYRKINKGGYKVYFGFLPKRECFFCSSNEELNQHHINYGKNIIVYLCKECHRKLHKLLSYSDYKNTNKEGSDEKAS
jgi:hypothetical protein